MDNSVGLCSSFCCGHKHDIIDAANDTGIKPQISENAHNESACNESHLRLLFWIQ
jgi:hypothetical protein